VTNPRNNYKESWMMENRNAYNMFNNKKNAFDNSFMVDNNNTIVTSHQDKIMNNTLPNSSNIDHLIHYLALPPSMGESTYANTGYFSMTSLGLSRSQVEITFTPNYQQPVMCEYRGNWPLCKEFLPSYTRINMNNYNASDIAHGMNVVDTKLLFFDDDMDFPSKQNCFDPNLVKQYIHHGLICVVANPSEPDV
jgi:hypothetical protein